MAYDPKLKNDEAFINERIDKLIDYGNKNYIFKNYYFL